MAAYQKIKNSPHLKKALQGLLIFFIIFTVTGFFIVPPVLKSLLVKKLSETLHREVLVRDISVNPYMLSLRVKGFSIKERGSSETFASFDELYINLQSVSALKRGLVLSDLKLSKPYVNIVRNEDLSYNFSDMIPGGPKEKSAPPRFSLNNIRIIDGRVDFNDRPKHSTHKVSAINATVPFISNLPYYAETTVQPLFEAKINGTPVSLKGRTKPFSNSLETELDVNIDRFDIPYYLAYVPFKMNFSILSGYINAHTNISYIQYRDKNPSLTLKGDIALKEFKTVDHKKIPLISLTALDIGIASSELLSRKMHLSSISLISPEVTLSRNRQGKLNIASLLPEEKEKKTAEVKNEKKDAPTVDIDEIKISGGKVSFKDEMQEALFRTSLETIDLKIDNLSNAPGRKASVSLSFETEAKESFRLSGNFSSGPLTSEGIVELKKIQLKKYSPYYAQKILFDIKNGDIDISTRYRFSKDEKGPGPGLSEMAVSISNLVLKKRDAAEDFLRVPQFAIKKTDIDLSKKELRIGEVSTQRGMVWLKRFSDDRLNVAELLPPKPVPSTDVQVKTRSEKKRSVEEKPWLVLLKKIAVEHYTVKVEDMKPLRPFAMTVDNIIVKGENISTAKNSKGKGSLSFTLDGKGTFSTNTSFSLDPISADIRLDAKGIDISRLQPYFEEKIKIIIADGSISAKGDIALRKNTDNITTATFKGEASLTNFVSVDKANSDDFLKWKSLYLSDINAGYNPFYLDLKEIAITDFYSRVIVNPDGSLNVKNIIERKDNVTAEKSEPARTQDMPEAAKTEETNKQIKIGKITLQAGTINFTDRHIKPSYTANLLEIGGRISGLSADENSLADVDLRGKLENYAPLEITGKINPLKKDLYVDLKIDFRNMELGPLTPYSGKYIGHAIEKGKLSLGLQYIIVKKKIDSKNKVFLDQFTLGERVDSTTATKLPVRLAIALLKDRNGEIHLDLPVNGSIDDPKFSIGGIIVKILVNLLVKAATSPFALLGAIFGGGEELSYLDFDYGSSAIDSPGEKKLATLLKALTDKPALKLEIEGHVDIDKDRDGLRQHLFMKKIKAQKLKDMVRKGTTSASLDEVKIEAGEYNKYLALAYREEKFPKPRNMIGIAKDLPASEMEKLILTHIEIREDDLRLLASQRALKIRDHILKTGQLQPERVFLIEPKSLGPEKKEKLKDSRVDFRLK